MKHSYLLRSLYRLILLTTLFSCSKDSEIIPVSSYLRKMIPYQNGQLVNFRGNDGQLIQTRVEVEEKIEACTTCQPNEKRQVIDVTLRNLANVDYTKVATMEIIDRAENYVFMTIWSPVANFFSGHGVDFKTVNKTSKFFADNERYILHQSIILGSKTYIHVLEIRFNPWEQTNSFDLEKLYYSKEAGIIQFAYNNGKSYQVVE